jgi:hypothetical protein
LPKFKQAKVIDVKEDQSVIVDCIEEMSLNVFDPVAVISESPTQYGYVKRIENSKITLVNFTGEVIKVPIGSLLQNLNGSEILSNGPMGVLAKLSMPEQPSFTIESSSFGILVAITPPQHTFRCSFYDIYVRDKLFSAIDPYWMPDVFDKAIADEYGEVKTFNGNKPLEFGKTYYITVVGKDKRGFKNINESYIGGKVQIVHFG